MNSYAISQHAPWRCDASAGIGEGAIDGITAYICAAIEAADIIHEAIGSRCLPCLLLDANELVKRTVEIDPT